MRSPGYSSNVVLTLLIGNTCLQLSHVGPRTFTIRDSFPCSDPNDAVIVIQVDDIKEQLPVFLPHGIQSREVAYF